MKNNTARKVTNWQPNEAANNPETMMGAMIAWQEVGAGKGRGVFVLKGIKKGQILETAPVIPVSKDSVVENGCAPDGYLLEWDGVYEDEEFCMPLGYIMMYNHSDAPNIMLDQDYENYTMRAVALRDIKKGEELCWNYNCEIWWDEAETA